MLMGGHVLADPLRVASLPRDTRWVLHVDVDGARATPLWELGSKVVRPHREMFLPKLEIIRQITGMSVPADVHDITLYGASYDEAAACILLHAAMDRDQTTSFLRQDPEFKSETYGDHTIMSWRDRDHDRMTYGAYVGKDLAVISPSQATLKNGLDTIDGKRPALAADSPLAPPAEIPAAREGRPLFWIAGEDLSDLPRLQKTESFVFEELDAANISVAWRNDQLDTRFTITAHTDKAARQMQEMALGMKALVTMAGSNPHAEAKAKLVSTMLQDLALTAEGKQFKGDWPLPLARIEAIADLVRAGALNTSTTTAPATDKEH
jgi:hypothetical protein